MKRGKKVIVILLMILCSNLVISNFLKLQNLEKSEMNSTIWSDSIETNEIYPNPSGNNEVFLYNFTGTHSIILDGSLSDWNGIPNEIIGEVNLSVGFDESDVYVAAKWLDSSLDNTTSSWMKTGMFNSTHAFWEEIPGQMDILKIGFTNGTFADNWIWTPSLLTNDSYAYEPGDLGALPFIRNKDENGYPIYENDSITLINQTTAPIGYYKGWFDNTPSESQAAVSVSYSYNASGNNYYIVEFKSSRISYNDDLQYLFDDLSGWFIKIGVANNDSCYDIDISNHEYKLSMENKLATLSLNPVPDYAYTSLYISGNVWDDYQGWKLMVYLDGWDDTYGNGIYDYADVNEATGNWSYLFIYNEYDMPLGNMTIYLEFYPRYEDPICFNASCFFDDIEAPKILGIVDIGERYPDGVPLDTNEMMITAGLSDNYDEPSDLRANLYYYKDDNVALVVPLQQYSVGSYTFTAIIPLEFTTGANNIYTYFIDVWDRNLNKVVSEKYSFTYGDDSNIVPTTTSTPSPNPITIPGFTVIIAIISLIGVSFILMLRKKKQNNS